MVIVAVSAVVAFVVTLYVTPSLISLAHKTNFLDRPDGAVKQHKQPTPYFGGLAVYAGFLAAIAFTIPFENNMFLFLVGVTWLLLLGLIDDFRVLKPSQKFLGQFIAVLCFLKAGFYLKTPYFLNSWHVIISGFWMLSVINAFNLVDVMDGLATTTAIGATLSFFCFAYLANAVSVMILLAAFGGSLLAFLWYNKPIARIYLGDAGSLFIGGVLANIPFLLDWGTYSYYGYLSPAVILAIPILEVTTLIVVRSYKGIPFFRGSPDHFSIYLRQQGWSVQLVLAYVFLLSLILLCGALLIYWGLLQLAGIISCALLFLVFWYSVLLKNYIF